MAVDELMDDTMQGSIFGNGTSKEALEDRQCPGIKLVLNKSLCHTHNFSSMIRT